MEPVNPIIFLCENIFNSLFYCIDSFFRRTKYYKLFLAEHEACICRYKKINAVEERAWNTSTKVPPNNKVTALLEGQTKDENKTPKQNQFNLINTKSFKLGTIQN